MTIRTCAVTIALAGAAFAAPAEQALQITRSGSRPAMPAPTEHFTGVVRIQPLFDAIAPARTSGASVTFEPGARTAWHTHPLGQRLIVTAGVGRIQRSGDPIEEIRTGDVVWIPPGQKHWHGASPTTAMTHIAVQESLDGKVVNWLDKVSDDQYRAAMNASKSEARDMKIRIKINDAVVLGTLNTTQAARDFAALLPLTLTMKDLFHREKYAHLPKRLSENGPHTSRYEVGDIAYWSPSQDVAIFYRPDGETIPAPGVITIGKIDEGVKPFSVSGSVTVTIEAAK